MRITRLVYLCVLIVLSALVVSVAAAAQDNSGGAHACQHDGWQRLARAESNTVAFHNQGECVSYAAQGGTLVPLAVVARSATLDFYPNTLNPGYCIARLSVTGYEPGTYAVRFTPGSAGVGPLVIESDGLGTVDSAGVHTYGPGVTVTAFIDGTAVDTATAC